MIKGEDIKNARKRMGKTQAQLAEDIGISPRQLSRIENLLNNMTH